MADSLFSTNTYKYFSWLDQLVKTSVLFENMLSYINYNTGDYFPHIN